MSSAGICRPNSDSTGAAFIARTPDGECILLSALHCFLKGKEEEEEDGEEPGGVAVEGLARLSRRSKKAKKCAEIDLQLDDPAELKRMIEENDKRLLRDRILNYTYWFCYKKVDQYVELKGSDFVAEHVRVEYSVVSMRMATGQHVHTLLLLFIQKKYIK